MIRITVAQVSSVLGEVDENLDRAHDVLRFWDGWHIIDPWGQIVTELPDDAEAIETVKIDLAMVRKRRREVALVRAARRGLLASEATRLTQEGGDA